MNPSGRSGAIGCLGGAIATLLVLGILLVVTVVLGVRTDGARRLVSDRLGALVGDETTVGSMRFVWPGALLLSRVECPAERDEAGPGFVLGDVRVSLAGGRRGRIVVTGGELVLALDGDVGWRPEALARLGRLPSRGLGEVSRLTRSWRKRFDLRVRGADLRWRDADGAELVAAQGLDFDVNAVQLPGRTLFYHRVRIDGLHGPGVVPAEGIRREWLASENLEFVDLDPPPDRKGAGGESPWGGNP